MQYSSISWTLVPHQLQHACIVHNKARLMPLHVNAHVLAQDIHLRRAKQLARVRRPCVHLRNLQLVISRRLTGAAEASARVAFCCGSRLWLPAHRPFVASGSCSSSRPTALLVAGPCSSSRSTALLVAGKAVELLPRGYGCRSGGASRFVHCGRA